MHQDGSSYREIIIALTVSKTMVFQAVQYSRKHSAAEKVPRKQKKPNYDRSCRCTDCPRVEKIRIDTVKLRLRNSTLFEGISRKKPLLSERNQKKRIEFAKNIAIGPL